MKLLLYTIVLFALGFFGTGLAINPNSPLNYSKLLSSKDNTSEVVPAEDQELEETTEELPVEELPVETEKTESKTTVKSNEGKTSVTTSSAVDTPVVTKRPADLSKPITISSKAININNNNITDFLADKKPNLLIIGNFSSESSRDLVDSLNVLLDTFTITSNVYVIDTSSTDLTINRGAIVIDETFSLSLSPSIYYQQGALVFYQRSLRTSDYNELHKFFNRIYK